MLCLIFLLSMIALVIPSYLFLCLKKCPQNRPCPHINVCVYVPQWTDFFFPLYDTGVICKQLLQFSNCTWCKHTMWENSSSICLPSWQMLSAVKQWLYFLLICSLAKLVLFQLWFWSVSFFKNPWSGDSKSHQVWRITKKNKIKSSFVFNRARCVLFAVRGAACVKNPAVGKKLRAGSCLWLLLFPLPAGSLLCSICMF